jgi:hypothetical protein
VGSGGKPMKSIQLGCAVALALGSLMACHSREAESPRACREGPADDVKQAGRTAGQGVEAGVETGVAGVKQAGKAVGGLVTGGRNGASREWEEGKAETKQEANEGADEVAAEQLPPCPERG